MNKKKYFLEKYIKTKENYKNSDFYTNYILPIYLKDNYKDKLILASNYSQQIIKFFLQRHIRGFDDSETWNLDKEMIKNLYDRVKKYQELTNVDTDADIITVNGKEESLTYWLNVIVSNCEEILIESPYEKELDDLNFDLPSFTLQKYAKVNAYNYIKEEYKNIEEEKLSYWVEKRLLSLYYDKINCEKEVWEIWAYISKHVWW